MIKKLRVFFSLCVCVCVCVCGSGGGRGEGGGGPGGREGTGKVIHLFQTALKILAKKYFHFGQFLMLSSVV